MKSGFGSQMQLYDYCINNPIRILVLDALKEKSSIIRQCM
jgi:hypothetical protein